MGWLNLALPKSSLRTVITLLSIARTESWIMFFMLFNSFDSMLAQGGVEQFELCMSFAMM